jgi:hypothetical protein
LILITKKNNDDCVLNKNKMDCQEESESIWFGFLFVLMIVNIVFISWHVYNRKNHKNDKYSFYTYVSFSILMSIIYITCFILISIFYTKHIGISLACFSIYCSYNLSLICFKYRYPLPNIFYVVLIGCWLAIFAFNLLFITFFYQQCDEDLSYTSKYYYYILFGASIGPSMTMYNGMFLILNIKHYPVIINLEKVRNAPDEDCSICLDELKKESCVKTPCSHIYHEKCIKVSLENSNKCPLCRSDFQV